MTRAFLLFCALGLIPIALAYGVIPGVTLDQLLGIQVETVNLTHVFRAVMGLYLAMAGLWLLGALRPAFTVPALVSCAVFMLGLAAGRLLSVLLDGLPSALLLLYLGLELLLGGGALWLLRRSLKVSKSE